jgi:hypothetical protein
MTQDEFKKRLKESFEELADIAGLKLTMNSVHMSDNDLSFQVSMSGDVKGFLEDQPVENDVDSTETN